MNTSDKYEYGRKTYQSNYTEPWNKLVLNSSKWGHTRGRRALRHVTPNQKESDCIPRFLSVLKKNNSLSWITINGDLWWKMKTFDWKVVSNVNSGWPPSRIKTVIVQFLASPSFLLQLENLRTFARKFSTRWISFLNFYCSQIMSYLC